MSGNGIAASWLAAVVVLADRAEKLCHSHNRKDIIASVLTLGKNKIA